MDEAAADPARLLRRALLSNAAFSAASGLLLAVGAPWFASHIARGTAGLREDGAGLLLFAAGILFLARRRRPWRTWAGLFVILVIAADLLWSAVSLLYIFVPSLSSPAGAVMTAIATICVTSFALLQAVGLWKARRAARAIGEMPLSGPRPSGKPLSAFVLAVLSAALFVSCGGGPADLRNAVTLASGESVEAREQGRSLIEEAADRHGRSALAAHSTLEIVGRDLWPGRLGFFRGWWERKEQRFKHELLLGTFASRLTYLDGPEEGTRIGLQGWRGWREVGGGPPAPTEDGVVRFYLPTLQYFAELPFRIPSAGIVTSAGQETLNGRDYDLVYATWDSFAPNDRNDQYEIWIERKSRLIEIVRYTVREAGPQAMGTIFFSDYREVGGVKLPFTQTVTISSPRAAMRPVERHPFHQIRVESARFDSIAPEELRPDPSARDSDSKPGSQIPL